MGVKRQWCGRLDKVESCQVGVFLGYVRRKWAVPRGFAVRDGRKGPLVVEIVKARVKAKTDCYLSNASPDRPLSEFARVAKADHCVEECIQRAQSEAGLADYEVRTWLG
jgi:hypothetical protein